MDKLIIPIDGSDTIIKLEQIELGKLELVGRLA